MPPNVTDSDMRAVGWLVAYDALVDIARGALGRARCVDPVLLVSLYAQWSALEDVQRQERAATSRTNDCSPRAALSPRCAEALSAFAQRLADNWPDRYGAAALRNRCWSSLAQAVTGCVGAMLVGAGSTPDTLLADVALVLPVMGVCSLITTVRLWRAYRLVAGLSHVHKTF